jgi:HlyD family secretion protein
MSVSNSRLIYPRFFGALIVLSLAPQLSAQGGPPEMPPAPVQTDFVRLGGAVQPLRLTGTIEPIWRSRVPAELDGTIQDLLVDEGDIVTTGTVLLKMRSDLFELAWQAAEARANSAEARLKELRNGFRTQELEVARASRNEASVAFEIAERNYNRFVDLFAAKSVSETELDTAKEALQTTKARLESAEASLKLTQEGFRQEVILAQEAQAIANRAEAKMAKDDYLRTEVRSPFAGTITRRFIERGDWVQEGDPVVEIEATSTVRLRANVPEAEYLRVRQAGKATITLDALPEIQFEKAITRYVPRADGESRSFPILFDIDNKNDKLVPGMLARLQFAPPAEGPTAMLIPKDAIVPQGPTPVVFKVDSSGDAPKAKRLEVTTGRFFGSAVEVITTELAVNDLVVIRGNERLQDGQSLQLNSFVTVPGEYVLDQSKFFKESQ